MVVVIAAVGGTLLASYTDGFEFFAFGGFWIWVFAAMLVVAPGKRANSDVKSEA